MELFPLENTNPESDQSNKSENFTSIFQQVFLNTSNNCIKENIEEEDKNRFFRNEFTKTKESTTTSFVNIIPFLFVVSKDESEDFIRKKRGRKAVENEDENENENQPKKNHNKFDTDNILTKIQVNYITFIVLFLNFILDFFNYDKSERFKQIDYKVKQVVNQKHFNDLKSKKLHEIICMKISPKNKKIVTQDAEYNKNLYIKLQSNPIINRILSQNYLYFFQNIYYKSEKIINLKHYGCDANITLSNKIVMFNDKIKSFKDKDYIAAVQKCVKDNYFEKKVVFHTNI